MLMFYFFQRNLLYYPTSDIEVPGLQTIYFDHDGLTLQGWVINPGRSKALLYFGGNSELISDNAILLKTLLQSYTIYLVNYRGYGASHGNPSESALLTDARFLYDSVSKNHSEVSALGRSLGTGVAVHLASERPLEKLALLTPYDSIAEVAQHHYPVFPARYLVKDRFDSAKIAPNITIPVLIVAAKQDLVVPEAHAIRLRNHLTSALVTYLSIEGAAHNDITGYLEYHEGLSIFFDEH
ncbi:MAG: pimeloyl-ACP methyl ester carboxylesterase [Gammaproteobacteria bacterium]|jgi:pimeloyl-ACP methyl ester carboxylesterase